MTISTRGGTLLLLACVVLLFVGGALAAGMLSVPGGVWLHWWPYGTGSALLEAMHPWAAVMAATVFVLGIGLYRRGQKSQSEFSSVFLLLHMLVVLGCGLAWFIPLASQTEGGKYPPINDVSTDLLDVPLFIAIAAHRIDAPNLLYGSSSGMSPERNAQLQQQEYPDLVTHFYDASAEDIYYRAYTVALDMGWDVVASVEAEGRIEATAKTFWFRLKEDVVIRVSSEDGRTRVDARSLSRVPGGDAGTNAKRLRRFFAKL